MKFKKFLKFAVVFLVIVASIGGTCYLFYSNLVLNQNSFSAVNDYIYGSSKTEFDASVNYVYKNLDSSDTRFKTYLLVNENLNEIAKTLNAYYINFDDTDLSGIEVLKKLDDLKQIQSSVELTIEEYELHTTSTYFDRITGANNLFAGLFEYLKSYSLMLVEINTEVKENVVTNNNADIKFDVIEIYLNICIDTFSNTTTSLASGILTMASSTNITAINKYFEIENGNIVTGNTDGTTNRDFTKYNNLFIKYYEQCDAEAFSKSFKSNLDKYTTSVDDLSNSSSVVEKAVCYFKEIFGVA